MLSQRSYQRCKKKKNVHSGCKKKKKVKKDERCIQNVFFFIKLAESHERTARFMCAHFKHRWVSVGLSLSMVIEPE